ncbi:uncharacterized protein LOC110995324 [Pieris rapae]|uniref:uncharacterized protein LOC110995324 n=1 Tax=Pieris rapae TaxID=64459 RepID=UPI001E27D94A|nr:uncharacterized protein LOC110995324 [Pieris rapae]
MIEKGNRFIIFLTLWSLSHAAYTSRMAPISRFRAPSAFRPGVVLQRAPYPPRLMPVHRAPFVVYRNMPHRYSIKPMSPVVTRNVFSMPWKTTARIPVPVTPEYDYARAASQPVIRTDGAIHTIPAPNLSLAEKPIVVADVGNIDGSDSHFAPEAVKPTYEVTENNGETQTVKLQTKVDVPAGFTKANSDPSFDVNAHNDGTPQFNPEYVQVQTPAIAPQEFSVQRFNGLPTHQDLIQSGAEGLIIPPDSFYQSDPLFLEKLQNQLLQKYPAVEFIPYTPTQIPSQIQQFQPTPFYFNNDHLIKQQPMSFILNDNRNIVQRQTQEGTVENLNPQTFTANNVTDIITASPEISTTSAAEITTVNIMEAQNKTNTAKVEENKPEDNRTNPIYYTQLGPNMSNITPIGFHTAVNNNINTSLEQPKATIEKSEVKTENTSPSTTPSVDTINYLDTKKPESNEISKDYNNFVASFEKPAESVNIAYSILRSSDKESQPPKENGSVLAGQEFSKTAEVTEASIKEDKVYNKERSRSSRQPEQVVTEKRSTDTGSKVVKAKIPPKTKLTFDDRTGEPVLRVYASYLDSPARKEAIATKLTNLKHLREAITKRQEHVEKVDAATVNDLAMDVNQFGMKIKAKNTDSVHILDEYNK